ncbi:MAG: PEP-CTERM sorting domain-containing protein [Desulfobacteraceae bacterium]|nr:PEP-CTERM sorting domain-containing protein [Desulfobacteraceae bacterium]
MKKKILTSLAFAVVFYGLTGVAKATSYSEYMSSVTTAANAMVAAQNTDGSFDWVNDSNPATSGYPNTQGATARGLVAAYKKTGNVNYLTAANKTADWIISNNAGGMYNKDIEFLFELASAGGTDYTAQAKSSAIAYVNQKMAADPSASSGANAIYNRYRDANWTANPGTLNGLKYWMIGEWGDVGRLIGDTQIYAGYTGKDMAKDVGTLLNNDLATFTTYSTGSGIDPYYSTLGFVGIVEAIDAGIDSGATYTNTSTAVNALAGRVSTWTGMGMDDWQTLGYTTYALSLFDNAGSLTGRDVLAGWINGGYFNTGSGAYLESNGEALLGLASAAAPVPEPTTMVLMGTGLVGFIGARRRKRH